MRKSLVPHLCFLDISEQYLHLAMENFIMCIDVFLLIPTNQLYLLIGQKYSLENNLPISNLSKALPTFAPWIHHTNPWPFGEYLILASILISIRPVQIPMRTCFLRPFQCPKQPFINMEGTVDASEKKTCTTYCTH